MTFSNITGSFFGGQLLSPSSPAITYAGGGTSNTSASWGTPSGAGQSGYTFTTPSTISATALPPVSSTALISLGTFQHINFPISSGTSITAMKLLFSADVDIDGLSIGSRSFLYQFSHDETPNSAEPCAYGGANNQGVNIDGCADRVNVNFISQSDSFMIDGVAYTLDVTGFVTNGTDHVTNFLTREGAVNSAEIVGRLALFTEAAAVPEPASWALMIGGFGMIGAVARRRRDSLATA
ncbi:THxN family PEP-CTERM protein [Glacieibacterium sp.]|uniref:THxN family PEP-CTERM protein n=1 Tax=Glacieibacterium sp. TaxID=2860237 RepID=UPI003B00F884